MEYAPGYHDCSYDHVQALSALLVPMPTDPLAVVVCPVYGLLGQMFSSKYACGLPWLCQPIITRLNSAAEKAALELGNSLRNALRAFRLALTRWRLCHQTTTLVRLLLC